MKTIVVNAGPRKNWNTAMMLQEAQKGAESAGAETEYVDLYELRFTGCRGCLACKRKDTERCRCYWNDDLAPLIDKILHADCVIIGSPIYFFETTAGFRALFERLAFCMLNYDGGAPYFSGKVNAGFIYTMNVSRAVFDERLAPALASAEQTLGRFLKGRVQSVAACETLQVNDYSQYSMGMFNEAERSAIRENRFPADLQAAFDLGAALSR